MHRGIAWFAAYAVVLIAPLGLALFVDPFGEPRHTLVELSVALGLLAVPIVLAQFALVSHWRAASRPFGTDALVQFHRAMGLFGLTIVLAHPVLLNLTGLPVSSWSPISGPWTLRSGALALWAIVALVVTSVGRRRLRLSYEAWRGIHLLLSLVAVAGMAAHVEAVAGYAQGIALRALLGVYVIAFGSVLLAYRVVRPLRMAGRPWTVVENLDAGGSTRLLRVRPDGHAGLVFEPGQFAWLVTGTSPFSQQQHPLSIASSAVGPADGSLQFAVKAIGDWSSAVVPALAGGTRVWVDGAYGAFTTAGKEAARGFVLIAGGIGIAPMRSMLLTMRDRGDRRPVLLVYAAHDETRAPFRDEIEALRAVLALDIEYVFEAPGAEHAVERGYVTLALLQRRLPPDVRQRHCFVCGPPRMMDVVEAALVELGVPARAIESERFQVV